MAARVGAMILVFVILPLCLIGGAVIAFSDSVSMPDGSKAGTVIMIVIVGLVALFVLAALMVAGVEAYQGSWRNLEREHRKWAKENQARKPLRPSQMDPPNPRRDQRS